MTEAIEEVEVDPGKCPISKVVYEEYDVEIFFANKGTSGTLSVLERGELAFIEWTPFDNYDVNVHMSFDEWGVIAHAAAGENQKTVPPLQIAVSQLDSIRQDIGAYGRPCIILTTDQTLPTLFFPKLESVYRMVQCLKRYLCFVRSDNLLIVDHSKAALKNAMRELELGAGPSGATNSQAYKKITYDFQDVYDVTLSGLSKVTNFIRGNLASRPQNRPSSLNMAQDPAPPRHLSHRPAEGDFEIYDIRKPLEQTGPVPRDTPLSSIEWESYLDLEGRVCRTRELKDRIFSGGIAPELRATVWPFILEVYPWNSTTLERDTIMEDKSAKYEVLQQQWKMILPCQLKRHTLHRDREQLVQKDVLRTDRALEFYAGDNNPNVDVLYNMLMSYCQYNYDLGYVQGMSDLISPLHMLFKEEVLTFWAFVGYMDLVEEHFFMDQKLLQAKLSELSSMIYYCDCELFNHLEKEDSSNFFFCFRWLLINFKREFSNDDILKLWEVLWTCPYDTDYALFIATAILLQERDKIITEKMSFSEILRYINSLSHSLDISLVIGNAEGLYHNIRSQPDIPFNIRTNILRMRDTTLSTPSTSQPTSLQSVPALSPEYSAPDQSPEVAPEGQFTEHISEGPSQAVEGPPSYTELMLGEGKD